MPLCPALFLFWAKICLFKLSHKKYDIIFEKICKISFFAQSYMRKEVVE